MGVVRLNITLPQKIAEQLDEIAGPKRKSSFIADCIKKRMEQIEKEKLKQLLKEGYSMTKKEDKELTQEFEFVDLKNWDEY